MNKKVNWIRNLFFIAVAFLAYDIGKNSNESSINKEALDQASYLVNEELDDLEAQMATRDSIISNLNRIISKLEN